VLGKLENGNEIQTVEIFVKDENDWIIKKVKVQSCLNTINERCISKKTFTSLNEIMTKKKSNGENLDTQ